VIPPKTTAASQFAVRDFQLAAFAFLKKPVNIEILSQVMRAAYQKVNDANSAVKELEKTAALILRQPR
jgi:DNA-binding LytR/AlgR family response regulator